MLRVKYYMNFYKKPGKLLLPFNYGHQIAKIYNSSYAIKSGSKFVLGDVYRNQEVYRRPLLPL